jgi:uncharacterized protein YggE
MVLEKCWVAVLEVQEIPQSRPYQEPRVHMMAREEAKASDYQSDVEFQQMKITASIKAVFEIN